MLIQYTLISELDVDTQKRLKQAASGLIQFGESTQGYVMFEGKYFSVSAVKQLTSGNRQLLRE